MAERKITNFKGIIPYFYIITLIYPFYGCTNSEEFGKIKKELRDTVYSYPETGFDSVFNLIPEYSEISKNIGELHGSFRRDLLLDPDNAGLYMNSKESGIAMGMYVADLGYSRHFERVQLCSDYLEAVRVLSAKLAMGTAEFNNIVPEVEQSLEDRDKLFHIIDSLMDAGKIFLSDKEENTLGVLFLSGFWLESAYIGFSSQLYENKKDFEDVKISHFQILENINNILDHIDDESVLTSLKKDLVLIADNKYNNELLLHNIEAARNKYKK